AARERHEGAAVRRHQRLRFSQSNGRQRWSENRPQRPLSLRQRQEVQKVPWSLMMRLTRHGSAGDLVAGVFGFLILALSAQAAILPDTIGDWKKGPGAAASVPDQKVWQEYGL